MSVLRRDSLNCGEDDNDNSTPGPHHNLRCRHVAELGQVKTQAFVLSRIKTSVIEIALGGKFSNVSIDVGH